MIEAVNAVVSNAPLIRGQVDQVDAARAAVEASAPQASEVTSAGGPRAPYVSPYIFMDVNFDKAVLQLRDGDSGDVVQQFPSESTLEARRRAEAFSARNAESSAALLEGTQEIDGAKVSVAAAAVPSVQPEKTKSNVQVNVPAVQAQAASAALEKSAQINTPHTSGESVSA
ncbi:MAG: hypothetical protein L6Q57_03960 [Alphaproteobacteria bacterium]|nr:hypothetical protein [Alphaproteobacteria bacterium]